MKLSHAEAQVFTHLQNNDHITRVQAQAVYRIFDLPGRIIRVRRAIAAAGLPLNITTTWCKDALGKRYARYAMVSTVRADIPRSHALVPVAA